MWKHIQRRQLKAEEYTEKDLFYKLIWSYNYGKNIPDKLKK